MKKYSLDGIKINYDIDTKDYPPFVVDKIEEFYLKIQKNNIPWKIVEDLQKLSAKFPKVPVFKNFLATVYEKLNKPEQLKSTLLKTCEKHPEYGLSRFALAKFYIDREELESAEEALKSADNINELFPEQKVFHFSEVQYFYYVLALLEIKKENYENVEELITLLDTIDTDSEFTDDVKMRLIEHKIDQFPAFMDEESSMEPVAEKILVKSSSEELPVLQNPVLYQLYTNEFYLNDTTLDEIRRLDRNSAISDLRVILKDAENRYYYYLESDIDFQYFPIHALLMLRDLKADEALEDVLDFLRNEEDFLEFWLGDFLSENYWEVIYTLSHNRIEVFKDFLKEPGIYAYAKGAVLDAMVQMTFDSESKKTEMIEAWKECLEFYNTVTEKDNMISIDFFSMFIGDIFPFDKNIFKTGIKKIYDKGWVNEFFAGSFDELYYDNSMPVKRKENNLSDIYTLDPKIGF